MLIKILFVPIMAFSLIGPFLPLIISKRSDWWEAKAYAGICVLGFIISRLLISSDLVAERARFILHENAKTWDIILSPLLIIIGGIIPLVAGLDSLFGWSTEFSLPTKILSLLVIISGLLFGLYALIKNRFFSSVVRIQHDREHHVIMSGPYRLIRHPGYASALMTHVATPVLLDSRWAFLPAIFCIILTVIRTHLEDKTLQAELDGYIDYTKQVRCRLIPKVW